MISRYNPVWEILKTNKSVELVTIPPLVKRIVKAIKRRRDMDTSYLFSQAENGKIYWIYYTFNSNTNVLKFELKRKYSLKDL